MVSPFENRIKRKLLGQFRKKELTSNEWEIFIRSLWTGSIAFGLVNIPIRLFSATRESNLDLDMLHKRDKSPIRFARVCKQDGEEVPYDEVVKGYKIADGEYVILSPEDFERANVQKTKAVTIEEFADEREIDVMLYDKPYYLEPEKGAEKAYALLREALRTTNKVGIARFVLRNREHIAVLKPEGNALILNQLRFAQELRPTKGLKLPAQATLKRKEMEMAVSLIEQLTQPFHPENFRDTYTDELRELIEQKSEGKTIRARGKVPEPTKAKDLVGLLQKSLRGGRREAA